MDKQINESYKLSNISTVISGEVKGYDSTSDMGKGQNCDKETRIIHSQFCTRDAKRPHICACSGSLATAVDLQPYQLPMDKNSVMAVNAGYSVDKIM